MKTIIRLVILAGLLAASTAPILADVPPWSHPPNKVVSAR